MKHLMSDKIKRGQNRRKHSTIPRLAEHIWQFSRTKTKQELATLRANARKLTYERI